MAPYVIVALDFSSELAVWNLVDQLDCKTCALKVGSELFTLLGQSLVRKLIDRGFKVFLDLKFHDIPNTVARACQVSADLGVWMLTLHASGGVAMLTAAKNAVKSYGVTRPLLVAVTVLTSVSVEMLPAVGITSTLEEQVLKLACLAKNSGMDGVVSSAHEVPLIKATCGPDFLTITPGIRLLSDSADDQMRIVTPVMARSMGSDYLVIGRSITGSLNPLKVLNEILTDE